MGTKYLDFCGNFEEDGILGILLGFKGKYCNIMTSFFFVQVLMGEIEWDGPINLGLCSRGKLSQLWSIGSWEEIIVEIDPLRS